MVQQAVTIVTGDKQRAGGVDDYVSPFKNPNSSGHVGFGLAKLFRQSPYWDKVKHLQHVSASMDFTGRHPMTFFHFTPFSRNDKGGSDTTCVGMQLSANVTSTARPDGDWLTNQQAHSDFNRRVREESKASASAIGPVMLEFFKEIAQRIPNAKVEGGEQPYFIAENLPTSRMVKLSNVKLEQIATAADELGREWLLQREGASRV